MGVGMGMEMASTASCMGCTAKEKRRAKPFGRAETLVCNHDHHFFMVNLSQVCHL
jgi:hypothetical protein